MGADGAPADAQTPAGAAAAGASDATVARSRDKIASLTIECTSKETGVGGLPARASSLGSDSTAQTPPPPGRAYGPSLAAAERLAATGRAAEALTLLEGLLAARPDDAAALCLHGACFAALGRGAEALAAYASALAADPAHAEALLGCAGVYRGAGMLEEALAALEQARALAGPPPAGDAACAGGAEASLAARIAAARAEVLTDTGTAMKAAGREGWRARYEAALEAAPSYAPAHYNLGVAAAEAGAPEEALARYARAVELAPGYAEAWCNAGALHRAAGRLDAALSALERAAAAAPGSPVVRANLAAALVDRAAALRAGGARAAGVAALERGAALAPRDAPALYALGAALAEAGEPHRAAFAYECAVAASPSFAEAWNNLGVLARELGDPAHAEACYRAALAARPAFPEALNNLAVALTQAGRAREAHALLRAALLAAPGYAEAHNNEGVLLRDLGDGPGALAAFGRAAALDPAARNAGQNRLLAHNYVTPGEDPSVAAAHLAWGRAFAAGVEQLPRRAPTLADAAPGRRLTVAYVSPDLFAHSVSYFAEAPLTWHDPSRVKLIVYDVRPGLGDARTERLRGAVAAAGGAWRAAARLSEAELAAAARADGVDILVDLTGHTAHNRLGALAARPAPVQCTWIGYPNSTGLAAVDYRFTDAAADPLGTPQRFAEALVRLPRCFLCYCPPPEAPAPTPPPAARAGHVTFGSFNALAKQTPEVLAVWGRILRAAPSARLVLKAKPFACESARQRWWRALEAEGVARARVDLLPLAPATADHLAQYSLMDIALDPWPYAGTTTTCEALWQGVPVLTLAGRCHAARVGASLLAAAGVGGRWVTEDADAYVARALEAAADVRALAALRTGLRARVAASPLCDARGFVSGLEGTYERLWARWVAGGGAEEEEEEEEEEEGGIGGEEGGSARGE
jgi:protein O-GlcNAc transferase